MLTCQICLQDYSILFEVSSCEHKFCEECCLSYINSSISHFTETKCLAVNCGKPLNKKNPIYEKVSLENKKKIQKLKLFKDDFKRKQFGCRFPDCGGYVDKEMKILKCDVCDAKHCQLCFNLEHRGICKLPKEEAKLRGLSFKKCPKCKIWTQKNQGCNYILCVCGEVYCYLCGMSYKQDQCRLKQLYEDQDKIRQDMNNITIQAAFNKNSFARSVLLLPIKIVLFLMVVYINTVMVLIRLIFTFLGFVFIGSLQLTVFIVGKCQIKNACLTCLLSLMLFVLYPLILAGMFIATAIAFLIHPCCRGCITYPFDISATIDNKLSSSMRIFTKMIIGIVNI